MQRNENAAQSIFLDDRIHRILVSGGRIGAGDGVEAWINPQPTSGTADHIVIKTLTSSVSIKCSGTYTPPDCGTTVCGPASRPHISEIQMPLNLRRIIVLGAELSADDTHKLVIVNNGSPAIGGNKDVLIYTNAGSSLEIPADDLGIKIPPSTGE